MDDNPKSKIPIHLQTNLTVTAKSEEISVHRFWRNGFQWDGMKKSIKRRFQEYLSNQVGIQTERGKNQFSSDCLINMEQLHATKLLQKSDNWSFHIKQTYLYNYPHNYWDQQTFLCAIQFIG